MWLHKRFTPQASRCTWVGSSSRAMSFRHSATFIGEKGGHKLVYYRLLNLNLFNFRDFSGVKNEQLEKHMFGDSFGISTRHLMPQCFDWDSRWLIRPLHPPRPHQFQQTAVQTACFLGRDPNGFFGGPFRDATILPTPVSQHNFGFPKLRQPFG